jgi:hypothetical protein
VAAAREDVEALRRQLEELNAQIESEVTVAGDEDLAIEDVPVRPRKSDTSDEEVVLAWVAREGGA